MVAVKKSVPIKGLLDHMIKVISLVGPDINKVVRAQWLSALTSADAVDNYQKWLSNPLSLIGLHCELNSDVKVRVLLSVS